MVSILKTTQEEADIYITIISQPQYFIVLDIEYLFEKITTTIQAYPLYPYCNIMDKNTHCIFGSSSSDVYPPPPPPYPWLAVKFVK